LAPVLDVARDARWGRIEETFGEDPTLVSHFGMAYVRGLQGEDLRAGVMATGKHFIAHSMSQGGQNCAPVHVGKRELYDIFLAPFQAAIRDAGLASIMNSYPELDGEVVATSRSILTDLLRDELGFEGLVVSDYNAIIMIHNFHNMAVDLIDAGQMAIRQVLMLNCRQVIRYGDPLKAALTAGELDIETIDTAVRRHLQRSSSLVCSTTPTSMKRGVCSTFLKRSQQRTGTQILADMVILKNDGLYHSRKRLTQ
jgi:beta-glucosidase